ncbi:unnamed protein product, partial [Mesorhabditis belari]|uniref:Uncharacterized protein n=1 Tax=Mesorhabditis belari TaxID=2138241 RepID=A0AAF3ERI5_9BILA
MVLFTEIIDYLGNALAIVVLVWTTLLLARKRRYHPNYRIGVVLLSGSILYQLISNTIFVAIQWSEFTMVFYALRRTRIDWADRHKEASLSKRFQLAESRSSARIFVPLVISNFCTVLFFLACQSINTFAELSLNEQQFVRAWMTLSLAQKSRFHQNFRFNVVLLSGSVFYLLLFYAILDVFNNLPIIFPTTIFVVRQFGWIWYRSAILTFVSERFACALMTRNYESVNHIWGKILAIIFTGFMAFLLVVVLLLTQNEKTVYTVVWTALIESITLPMTIYILMRTKSEWKLRHRGASLSQRFQLSEFRSSVKFFVPLVLSNFVSVFIFLGLKSVITFVDLDDNGLAAFNEAIDVLDFYQRLFYVGCVVRTEEDSLNDFLNFFKRKLKWREKFPRKPNRIRDITMAKISQDEYFNSIKIMWA